MTQNEHHIKSTFTFIMDYTVYLDIVYLRSAQYLNTSCKWLGVECYFSVPYEANINFDVS